MIVLLMKTLSQNRGTFSFFFSHFPSLNCNSVLFSNGNEISLALFFGKLEILDDLDSYFSHYFVG